MSQPFNLKTPYRVKMSGGIVMIFVDDSRDVAFIDGNLRVYWRGVDLTDRYTDVELKEFEQVMREEGVEPFAAEESESA